MAGRTSRTIRIRRIANLIHVFGPPESLLEQLTFRQQVRLVGEELRQWTAHQLATGVRHPQPFRYDKKILYSRTKDGIIVPSGLTTRVCEYLRILGCHVEIEDTRKCHLPAPDYSCIGDLREDQMRALAAIVSHDSGVIDYVTASGKSFLIPYICQIWPTARILIIAPRVSIVRTLTGYLLGKGIDVGQFGGGKHFVRRVTVSTTNSISALQKHINLDEVDIVIFDEVYAAGAAKVADDLSTIRFARMYGFADGPFTRSDGRNKVVESLFGPVICNYDYESAVTDEHITPIKVLMIGVGSQGFDDPGPTTRMDILKRRSYWRNAGRNSAIADAVRIGTEILQIPFEECQTLIMCQTVDHALHLKQMLPEFTVCHAGNIKASRKKRYENAGFDASSVEISKRQLEEYQKQFEEGVLKHVIATMIWSAGVNFRRLPLLIRADGATSEMFNRQIPGRLMRLFEGKTLSLMVDFYDTFSPWARRRSDARLKLYRRRKWEIIDHPTMMAR